MEDASKYLKVGMRATATEEVSADNIATKFGSGNLEVYGTPAMVALMENAAVRAVDEALPEGWTTVGIAVDIRHLAPTPPGRRVRADAELEEVDGRRLVFSVTATDEQDKIGTGRHERYCVEMQPFLQRANQKSVDV